MWDLCPIHRITRIIAFEASTQVHDFNLHINFCSFKKIKNYILDKHLNFNNVFTEYEQLQNWMNDNPCRLIRHAFFRRYVRVEVPCLHDDGNCILFVRVLFFCMLTQLCFLNLCSKFHSFFLCSPWVFCPGRCCSIQFRTWRSPCF